MNILNRPYLIFLGVFLVVWWHYDFRKPHLWNRKADKTFFAAVAKVQVSNNGIPVDTITRVGTSYEDRMLAEKELTGINKKYDNAKYKVLSASIVQTE